MKRVLFVTPFNLKKRNKDNAAAANRIDLVIRGMVFNDKNIKYDLFHFSSEMPLMSKTIFLLLKWIKFFIILLHYDYLYVYGEVWFPFIYSWAKICNCRIIIERCEYPTFLISNSKNNVIRKFRNKCFLNEMKYAWMFVTCSNALIRYYSLKLNNNCKIVNIPLVVDLEDGFDILEKVEKNKKYISYCGNMGNNKDGVDILIKAFKIFSRVFPDYRLRLVGSASDQDLLTLSRLVENLDLKSSVDFLGYMPHSNVIKELQQSSLLTLSRPSNKQAEGGMPSKLAEYLLTGVPTLVTDVGEISNYVTNNVNCFIAEPDSAIKFAEKMISNLTFAESIGLQGQLLAKQFDYKLQTKQIVVLLV